MFAGILTLVLAQVAAADTSYFQQGVDYRIEATLDDASSLLRGRARLRYTNHSRQGLDTLYFHEHLNAFRPNSAWAKRELQFNNRRFQDLGGDQHAFSRLQSVTVGGRRVSPVYPGGDDSTVVAIPLPAALAPGGSTVVVLDWQARTSTLPRRQGRRGRHFDFAQWYPRIAVFERGGWQLQPLVPQGEFYGEFGSYDVTLEVAQDQVIGATGVPVEGDPGWQRAAAQQGIGIDYRRNAYPAKPAESLGLLSGSAAAGRKRVRWRAEQVHHFAWTTNPQYIYETGKHRDVAIHVLYQPGDTAWDEGITVRRTAQALAYYDTLFGPYPYPQITNVHRIEGGGTEFPMMVMDGSPGFGLILHEVGHQWMHGIFANNEFVEGWLDEGFTSFTNSWFEEEQQGASVWQRDVQGIVSLEQAGRTQPLALRSEAYRDFDTYGAMTYTKPALVLRMLRELVGEEVTRRALKDFYQPNRFRHVNENDLKSAFERASGQDLDWFFQQWFHTTGKLDYSLGAVSTAQQPDGSWRTRIEVQRSGENFMPVIVRVGDVDRRLDARDPAQVVTIDTRQRPTEVVLDPDMILIDVNPTNNRKPL
jgi:peptidase M1-like protein